MNGDREQKSTRPESMELEQPEEEEEDLEERI